VTQIPEDTPTPASYGQQLALFVQPARKPISRAEWQRIELTRFGRAHQSYNAELRQNARDFHRHVFTGERREHPPIA